MKKLTDGPGPSLLILFSTSEIPRPLTHLFSGEENLSKHKSHACHIMGLSFPFLSSLASQPACALIPIPIDSRQPESEETRGAVLELATRRPLSLSLLRSILHDCEDRTRSARDRIDQGARTTARAAVGSFSARRWDDATGSRPRWCSGLLCSGGAGATRVCSMYVLGASNFFQRNHWFKPRINHSVSLSS